LTKLFMCGEGINKSILLFISSLSLSFTY
jgi:hypothetical protein